LSLSDEISRQIDTFHKTQLYKEEGGIVKECSKIRGKKTGSRRCAMPQLSRKRTINDSKKQLCV